MKKIIVFVADGFEETELVFPVDIMRRAGIHVTLASIGGELATTSSHGITIVCDGCLDEIDTTIYDAAFLPGGMPGSLNLSQCWRVNESIIRMNGEGKLICAICAAPAVVLANAGLLEERRATCYPGSEENCQKKDFLSDGIVVDKNIITAKSAAYAHSLGLEMVKYLIGEKKSKEVAQALYF